jgi:hypothetical protein
MIRSPKTTVLGATAGFTMIAATLQDGLEFQEDWQALLVGFCLVLLGYLSRDDNVSSKKPSTEGEENK